MTYSPFPTAQGSDTRSLQRAVTSSDLQDTTREWKEAQSNFTFWDFVKSALDRQRYSLLFVTAFLESKSLGHHLELGLKQGDHLTQLRI